MQHLLPKETRLHVKRFIATHYYFEGKGSLVTLSKSETEKYLKQLEEFNAANGQENEQKDTNDPGVISQWVAILNNNQEIKLILKK